MQFMFYNASRASKVKESISIENILSKEPDIENWTSNPVDDKAVWIQGEQRKLSWAQRLVLIREAHKNFGHFGESAVFNMMKHNLDINYAGLKAEVKYVVKRCIHCLKIKLQREGFYPSRTLAANEPFDRIQYDLKGPMPDEIYKWMLVIADLATGLIILEKIQKKTAREVVEALYKTYMIYGIPREVDMNGVLFHSCLNVVRNECVM